MQTTKLNPEVKTELVRRLRSGDYEQGKEALCSVSDDGTEKHCCLGVLAEQAVDAGVAIKEIEPEEDKAFFSGMPALPGLDIAEWAGLDSDSGVADVYSIYIPSFAVAGDPRWEWRNAAGGTVDDLRVGVHILNDDGWSFEEIADLIELYA